MKGRKIQAALGLVLAISLAGNAFYYMQLQDARETLTQVNALISNQVERNIRLSMRYTKDFKDSQSAEDLQDLQRVIQELVTAFQHWINLNQTESRPNPRMAKGLSALEALRNTITHHLNNQYVAQGNVLSQYDIEFLDKTYENLDRLLLAYHSIEGRLEELKNLNRGDSGLTQISQNIEEVGRLYRHSSLPNRHPKYMGMEEAHQLAINKISSLANYELKEMEEKVHMRDGVHYYELQFLDGKEVKYIVWMDAVDGIIRNYELKKKEVVSGTIFEKQALEVAQSFIQRFHEGELLEESFTMEGDKNRSKVYSFRFTPVKNGVQVVSDAYIINVDAQSGKIVKFSNDFTKTQIPFSYIESKEPAEIQEENEEKLGEMSYNGLAVVRSFHTHYKPRVTHSFRITEKGQQIMVFYDVTTGMKVHEMYYVYHPIS